MLLDSQNGTLLLKHYSKNKSLNEEQRNLLINTIAKYVDCKGFACSLSDCYEMERQICVLFPMESKDYYSSSLSGKRGKLYNKIYNLKRHSKSLTVEKDIFQSEDKPTTTCNKFVPEADSQYALECIRNNNVTADEFDIYWRKCSQLRFSQIENSKSTGEILENWPEYSKPSGMSLIDIDFSLKYPKSCDLISKWSLYSDKILRLISNKIPSKYLNNIDKWDEESKIFSIFWHLHQLFPPQHKVVTDKTGAKCKRKYSISDSQTSFAIIADNNKEIELKLELLKLRCTNIQPLLLVIGEETCVKQIYIYTLMAYAFQF
ncbi:uncharacterized protein [Musca autumnalis]|uniref:uncharacterized protein n=1 Tax=Musca autumnalis TaxID=221902 RepID=UPI003CF811D4